KERSSAESTAWRTGGGTSASGTTIRLPCSGTIRVSWLPSAKEITDTWLLTASSGVGTAKNRYPSANATTGPTTAVATRPSGARTSREQPVGARRPADRRGPLPGWPTAVAAHRARAPSRRRTAVTRSNGVLGTGGAAPDRASPDRGGGGGHPRSGTYPTSVRVA